MIHSNPSPAAPIAQVDAITHSAGTQSLSTSSRRSSVAIAPNAASSHTDASPRMPAWIVLKWRSYSASLQHASSGAGGGSATGRLYEPQRTAPYTLRAVLLSERLPTAYAYGLLAVVLAVVAMIPSLRPAGWSVTALPRVGSGTPMARAARNVDPSFRLVDQGSYDGQFYWGVAVDPLARGDVHDAFDTASYRYGHPLFGWLGWIASAGQASAAAWALVVVGLLALFTAAVAAAELGPGYAALFGALNPGLLYAAAHDLAEPLCVALLLVALNAYVRDRRTLLLVCLALLPLAKEQLVLVPLVLAVWPRRDLRILATVVPAVVWWIYARWTLGAWFTSGDNALGV